MAEQPNNLEMFDVLASIRRLVSEERKAAPARIEPVPPQPPRADTDMAGGENLPGGDAAAAPQGDALPDAAAPEPAPAQPRYAGLPQESRFVLTAALRVGDEAGGADTLKAWDDDAHRDAHPATACAMGSTAIAAQSPTAEIDEIDRRTASLEETIAELEAAVADIGSEFEPDGGESDDLVTELFPDPVGQAPDLPAQRGGFSGIMAGFETMLPPDEVLDTPVTGDALIPPLAFSRPAAAPGSASPSPFGRAWPVSDKDSPVQPTADQPRAADASFAHAVPPLSHRSVTGDQAERAADPAHHDGQSAGSATDAWDKATPDAADGDAGMGDPVPDAVDMDGDPVLGGAAGLSGAAAEPDGHQADEAQADEAPATDALGEESVAGHAAGADGSDGDRPEEGPSEPARFGPRLGRPQIVRTQASASEAADDQRDLTGGASHDDLPDEDEPDLFNPLAGADMDVDAMRDIVAELVREELRGVLGERITRNLRALVRNEIRKALADSGLARG